jgi:histidine ammonia-lyase
LSTFIIHTVDKIVESGEIVYGINTGFGLFSNVTISADKIEELQENLIRSHSAGVGPPLSPERTRMLLALRINVLAKGHSGISVENVNKMVMAFNHDCLPYVPEKGTVGASGDLAPLSHLALGLMGEGKMWNFEKSSTDDNFKPKLDDAMHVLKQNGCSPIKLSAKEGNHKFTYVLRFCNFKYLDYRTCDDKWYTTYRISWG